MWRGLCELPANSSDRYSARLAPRCTDQCHWTVWMLCEHLGHKIVQQQTLVILGARRACAAGCSARFGSHDEALRPIDLVLREVRPN